MNEPSPDNLIPKWLVPLLAYAGLILLLLYGGENWVYRIPAENPTVATTQGPLR